MSLFGRRKSDRAAQRVLVLLLGLTLASSLLAIYLAYRAIKAMDETSNFARDAYILGRSVGKAPKYSLHPERE